MMERLVEHRPTARDRALYSDQVLAALDLSPALPPEIRFALVTSNPERKPYAFDDLAALARRVHRDRRGHPLRLTPARLRFRDGPRSVVGVFALEPMSGSERLVGHAWISGRPWEALQNALDRAEAATGAWEGQG